jgi:hypothetical protein
MKEIMLVIVGVSMSLTLAYSFWQLGRKINYNLAYRSMVQNEIRNIVKPEALK